MNDAVHAALKSAVGGFVLSAAPGIGSFLTVTVSPRGKESGKLAFWVYFANWALLVNENEVVSSDMDDDTYSKAITHARQLTGAMVKFVDIRDGPEVHIGFTGNRVLEVWPLEDRASAGRSIMRIYAEDRHLGDVVSERSGSLHNSDR